MSGTSANQWGSESHFAKLEEATAELSKNIVACQGRLSSARPAA